MCLHYFDCANVDMAKDSMPRVPRSWVHYSSKICLDHRADPCAHDINVADLAALGKDCPISGTELHTFIGEQGNMFHVCELSNAEDVVWHIRGMVNLTVNV